jgi:hypothetical protein
MSWILYTVPVPQAGKETIDAVLDHAKGAGVQFDSDETKDQVAAAAAALDELIQSGAVGDGPFFADLGGHANPDHKAPGEVVTVSLRQASGS